MAGAGAGIPLEILQNAILPRLPAKSLMRFKCVSKPWLALISTHEFIKLHLSYANTNHLLILTANHNSFYSFNLDLPAEPALKLPTFGTGTDSVVVGSCNGLLCIQSFRPYSLTLLNPSTHTYRQIPSLLPPRRCSALNFGFGYDSTNHDYKLVRIADRYPSLGFLTHQMDRIVHLYSLSTNSWEFIELTSPHSSMGLRQNGALLNNFLLHWNFWCSEQAKYRIRCFHLCQKKWTHDVPLPGFLVMKDAVVDFGVLDGFLYLSTKNQQQSAIDIWVMNDYGVKESWTRLCQISDSRVFRSLRISPIAYTSLKHQILLTTVDKTEHKILWYDIQGESAETFEINGVADCIWIWIVASKATLVSVPGGSQIRTNKEG